MDRTAVAVVLAGGTGTRLYPATRRTRPKPFLALDEDRSLLARTVARVGFADETIVVTDPANATRVRDHLTDDGERDATVLAEPAPRDTGPALVYAAVECRDRYTDPVMLCVPSDHHIEGDFEHVARQGLRVAVETRGLVTVGIQPTRAATGYGYLQHGRMEDGYAPVEQFIEKPNTETANRLVQEGCLWNAGIFAWTPTAFLSEARQTPLGDLVDAFEGGDPARAFDGIAPTSIDFSVLERTDHAFVVPADLAWDDLGTWDALARVLETDDAGNVAIGETLTIDTRNSVIASDDKHVSVVGCSDLVVAAFDDRVLVVPTDEAQRVRDVVARLRQNERD